MEQFPFYKVKCIYHDDMDKCILMIDLCRSMFCQDDRNYICSNFIVGWSTLLTGNRKYLEIIGGINER